MTARKSMAPKRKGKKQYPMVTFPFADFDGEFTLPQLDSLPLGVAAALRDGDIARLIAFIKDTAPECAEAVEDLSGDEAGAFMESWGDASGVESGKSPS